MLIHSAFCALNFVLSECIRNVSEVTRGAWKVEVAWYKGCKNCFFPPHAFALCFVVVVALIGPKH